MQKTMFFSYLFTSGAKRHHQNTKSRWLLSALFMMMLYNRADFTADSNKRHLTLLKASKGNSNSSQIPPRDFSVSDWIKKESILVFQILILVNQTASQQSKN